MVREADLGPRIETLKEYRPLTRKGKIHMALGTITFFGGLAAAGVLFPSLGYRSLAFGLATPVGLTWVALSYSRCRESKIEAPKSTEVELEGTSFPATLAAMPLYLFLSTNVSFLKINKIRKEFPEADPTKTKELEEFWNSEQQCCKKIAERLRRHFGTDEALERRFSNVEAVKALTVRDLFSVEKDKPSKVEVLMQQPARIISIPQSVLDHPLLDIFFYYTYKAERNLQEALSQKFNRKGTSQEQFDINSIIGDKLREKGAYHLFFNYFNSYFTQEIMEAICCAPTKEIEALKIRDAYPSYDESKLKQMLEKASSSGKAEEIGAQEEGIPQEILDIKFLDMLFSYSDNFKKMGSEAYPNYDTTKHSNYRALTTFGNYAQIFAFGAQESVSLAGYSRAVETIDAYFKKLTEGDALTQKVLNYPDREAIASLTLSDVYPSFETSKLKQILDTAPETTSTQLFGNTIDEEDVLAFSLLGLAATYLDDTFKNQFPSFDFTKWAQQKRSLRQSEQMQNVRAFVQSTAQRNEEKLKQLTLEQAGKLASWTLKDCILDVTLIDTL